MHQNKAKNSCLFQRTIRKTKRKLKLDKQVVLISDANSKVSLDKAMHTGKMEGTIQTATKR